MDNHRNPSMDHQSNRRPRRSLTAYPSARPSTSPAAAGSREPSPSSNVQSQAVASLLDHTEPPGVRRALLRSMTLDSSPELSPSVYSGSRRLHRRQTSIGAASTSSRLSLTSKGGPSPPSHSLFSSYTHTRHSPAPGDSHRRDSNAADGSKLRIISAVVPGASPSANKSPTSKGHALPTEKRGRSAKTDSRALNPEGTLRPTRTDEATNRQNLPVRTITNLLGSGFAREAGSKPKAAKKNQKASRAKSTRPATQSVRPAKNLPAELKGGGSQITKSLSQAEKDVQSDLMATERRCHQTLLELDALAEEEDRIGRLGKVEVGQCQRNLDLALLNVKSARQRLDDAYYKKRVQAGDLKAQLDRLVSQQKKLEESDARVPEPSSTEVQVAVEKLAKMNEDMHLLRTRLVEKQTDTEHVRQRLRIMEEEEAAKIREIGSQLELGLPQAAMETSEKRVTIAQLESQVELDEGYAIALESQIAMLVTQLEEARGKQEKLDRDWEAKTGPADQDENHNDGNVLPDLANNPTLAVVHSHEQTRADYEDLLKQLQDLKGELSILSAQHSEMRSTFQEALENANMKDARLSQEIEELRRRKRDISQSRQREKSHLTDSLAAESHRRELQTVEMAMAKRQLELAVDELCSVAKEWFQAWRSEKDELSSEMNIVGKEADSWLELGRQVRELRSLLAKNGVSDVLDDGAQVSDFAEPLHALEHTMELRIRMGREVTNFLTHLNSIVPDRDFGRESMMEALGEDDNWLREELARHQQLEAKLEAVEDADDEVTGGGEVAPEHAAIVLESSSDVRSLTRQLRQQLRQSVQCKSRAITCVSRLDKLRRRINSRLIERMECASLLASWCESALKGRDAKTAAEEETRDQAEEDTARRERNLETKDQALADVEARLEGTLAEKVQHEKLWQEKESAEAERVSTFEEYVTAVTQRINVLETGRQATQETLKHLAEAVAMEQQRSQAALQSRKLAIVRLAGDTARLEDQLEDLRPKLRFVQDKVGRLKTQIATLEAENDSESAQKFNATMELETKRATLVRAWEAKELEVTQQLHRLESECEAIHAMLTNKHKEISAVLRAPGGEEAGWIWEARNTALSETEQQEWEITVGTCQVMDAELTALTEEIVELGRHEEKALGEVQRRQAELQRCQDDVALRVSELERRRTDLQDQYAVLETACFKLHEILAQDSSKDNATLDGEDTLNTTVQAQAILQEIADLDAELARRHKGGSRAPANTVAKKRRSPQPRESTPSPIVDTQSPSHAERKSPDAGPHRTSATDLRSKVVRSHTVSSIPGSGQGSVAHTSAKVYPTASSTLAHRPAPGHLTDDQVQEVLNAISPVMDGMVLYRASKARGTPSLCERRVYVCGDYSRLCWRALSKKVDEGFVRVGKITRIIENHPSPELVKQSAHDHPAVFALHISDSRAGIEEFVCPDQETHNLFTKALATVMEHGAHLPVTRRR